MFPQPSREIYMSTLPWRKRKAASPWIGQENNMTNNYGIVRFLGCRRYWFILIIICTMYSYCRKFDSAEQWNTPDAHSARSTLQDIFRELSGALLFFLGSYSSSLILWATIQFCPEGVVRQNWEVSARKHEFLVKKPTRPRNGQRGQTTVKPPWLTLEKVLRKLWRAFWWVHHRVFYRLSRRTNHVFEAKQNACPGDYSTYSTK